MKFQSLRPYLFAVVCSLLPSCAVGPAVSVKTDYNHKISFAAYHTYALDLGESGLRPTGQAALTDALKSNLATRGINETARGKADLIVVGSHGRGFWGRLLGSVSNGVVHHAPCSVLVVRK